VAEARAWGRRVSPDFRTRVRALADGLGCSTSGLMAYMAWEIGRTFSRRRATAPAVARSG
jgi:hypothetical protein